MSTDTIERPMTPPVPRTGRARKAPSTRSRRSSHTVLWGAASIGTGVVLWQVAVWIGILPARYFPSIAELVTAWIGLFVDSGFWMALGQTLFSSFLGLLLSAVVAIPVGIAIGRNAYLFHATRFILEFFRPIPTVALIPLVVLLMGTDLNSKTLLVFLASFFPILVQTTSGTRDIDPVAVDTAATYGFGPLRRLFCVLLPAASPYIMTGIRVSAAISLLVSVSTEIIVGSPGLGQAILIAQNSNAIDEMYALIAMTGFLGIGINALVVSIESRATGWARTGTGDE